MTYDEFRYQDTTAPDPAVLAALCGEMGRIINQANPEPT
jgi:hypothetical protein